MVRLRRPPKVAVLGEQDEMLELAKTRQVHHRFWKRPFLKGPSGNPRRARHGARPSFDQAAGVKRAKPGIGTTLVSRGSASPSQTSRSAYARSSISWSLWKGVGVMRSRSVPRGTVGQLIGWT